MTGEKLAGVDKEFLTFYEDRISKEDVVEETGDATLIKDLAGTIVGERPFAKRAGVTLKYLRRDLLPNSWYHAHEVPIGPDKTILITHENSVDAGTAWRKG